MPSQSLPAGSESSTARLGAWIIRGVTHFIPTRGRDRVELIRTRLLVVFSFMVAANAALFAFLHHIHHVPGSSYVVVYVLVTMFCLSLSFPIFLRAGVAFSTIGPAFMVFFEVFLILIACSDGGLKSGAIFWLAVLPIVAACVGGGRLGWTVSGISVVAGVLLFGVTALGFDFPQSLSPEDASKHYILNFLSAALLVGVTAALYEGPIVRHLEDELRARGAAQAEAEAASRSKSALLANMSHEFRTPLTAVLSGTEILREEATDDDKPILESMERGARRLMATLEGVIDLSRIDGGHSLATTPMELAPVIRDAAGAYAQVAIKKGITFEVRGTSASGRVDPVAFRRVVSAIVDNAVRFTAEGGVVVSFEEGPGHAVLSVMDTGVGMTTEFAERAVEPFLQASEGHARTHEGLGLGLTLASRLTHAMGGALSIRTAPGRGTAVRIELPSTSRTERSTHHALEVAASLQPMSLGGTSLIARA